MNIVLLGDSIFDNKKYVKDEQKSVIDHLRSKLQKRATGTLLAQDGAVARDLLDQVQKLPHDTSHIIVSCGGNDALKMLTVLYEESVGVRESLLKLAPKIEQFKKDYQLVLGTLRKTNLSLIICTIYEDIPNLAPEERLVLSFFNDTIVKEALKYSIEVIDLRHVCTEEIDYSMISPIEPSEIGGEKIVIEILNKIIKDRKI